MDYTVELKTIIDSPEMIVRNDATSGPSQALLRYGKWMDTYAETPSWMPPGIRKQCYGNSVKALLAAMGGQRDDIHYAEGYAISKTGLPIPIQHAWLVDGRGRVIDPTWKDHADHLYFGVEFDTEFVIRMLEVNKWEPGLLVVPSLMRRHFGSPTLFEAALAKNPVLTA